MQFIYQPLTWAFLLVLVPVLIHLINLMRQKRVQWAAMEFLLVSHRKHHRWVWLKQLLLLLLRMLAIAVAVAMLAGLITKDQWSFLGGQATHHFVLLDDSLSMSDRTNAGRAFDQASQALRRIADQLANLPTAQKVTLLRYSQATKSPVAGGMSADLNSVLVDSGFAELMEQRQRQFEVTELSLSAGPALEQIERLMKLAPETQRVLYILSDFRVGQWDQSPDVRESLRRLRKLDAELHFIRCTDVQHENLAVIDIAPEPGTLAAGVPLIVNVRVKNYGAATAQQVPVRFSATSYPAGVIVSSDEQIPETQVNSLLIEDIPAGEVVSRQAQFKFDRAGQHVVEATLPSDAVLADNRRRTLIDIPPAIPVLIVDGGDQQEDAYYLSSVFAPGRIVTGIEPVVRSASYLRDVADTELARFAAVYLLNIERLDARALRGLERYVSRGGGLAIFAGPLVDAGFLNEWYDGGKGLFPVTVQADRELFRVENDTTPDLQVNDHPIFAALVDAGGKNRPLTRSIRIDRYLPVDPTWQPTDNPRVEVLATIRGVDPLVVSQAFGDGLVVAFLSTASPSWNNWALGPSYPVVILQLHGFLSSQGLRDSSRLTGEAIELQLDKSRYQPAAEVEFQIPQPWSADTDLTLPTVVKKEPLAGWQDLALMTYQIGADDNGRTGETDLSGIYAAKMMTLEGKPEQQRFVVNVPVGESDLATLGPRELSEQYDDLRVEVHNAVEMEYESSQQDGFSWGTLLAGVLIFLLLVEQLVAYSASYHPPIWRGVA